MLEFLIGAAVGAVFGGAFGVCMFALVSAGGDDDANS